MVKELGWSNLEKRKSLRLLLKFKIVYNQTAVQKRLVSHAKITITKLNTLEPTLKNIDTTAAL